MHCVMEGKCENNIRAEKTADRHCLFLPGACAVGRGSVGAAVPAACGISRHIPTRIRQHGCGAGCDGSHAGRGASCHGYLSP